MENYLSKAYAATTHTILHYRGGDISLAAPALLDNMPVYEIGDGAFMESDLLQQVVIPDTVRRIGRYAFANCGNLRNVFLPYTADICDNAFSNCSNLTNLTFYRCAVSERKYAALLASSFRANRTARILNTFPEFPNMIGALRSVPVDPANLVPCGIPRLFTSYNLAEEKGLPSLTRNLDGFSMSGGKEYATETDCLLASVKAGLPQAADASSEHKNDVFLKTDKYPIIKKTAVFTFDTGKTIMRNGTCQLLINIKLGYHFWQSRVPVNHNGNTYYIYRRHYLSSEPGLDYIRKDTAVFSAAGPVTDREEAQEVYAKYRLLALL